MTSVFISYRRLPSAMLAQHLAHRLQEYGIEGYVDVRQVDGGGPFPTRLRDAIAECDVFVCLVADSTFDSAWVREEIAHAHRLGKVLIPVFQESYTPIHEPPNDSVRALLDSDGVKVLDRQNLYVDEAIAQLARMIAGSVPQPEPVRDSRRMLFIGAVIALLLAAVVMLALSGIFSSGGDDLSADEIADTKVAARHSDETATAVALLQTPTPQPTNTETPRPTDTDMPRPTDTQTPPPTATQTPRPTQTETTVPTNTPPPTATQTPRPTNTETPQPTVTETPQPTDTETPPPTATPDTLTLAQTPVSRNADWEPYVEDFDGVAMVLVPAGCFEMGSTDGDSDEQPVHTVCFEEPFWIDRYEVSNGQFAAVDGDAAEDSYFSGDDRPREQITWYEANDFCESRGARLPTEAEWEYAARGPDALVYPWGDEWVPDNVVWSGNSNGQTVSVGSKPSGASWVGALDMSGNVWEWVADWYAADYYGTLAEGAVSPQGPETGSARVLRGGSWVDFNSVIFRAALRGGDRPQYGNDLNGFRCARSRGS